MYTEKDREALGKCMDLGYKFPEITTWIRANKKDFKLVKDLGIRETGILVSCSDYHIFKKMKMTRRQAVDYYLETIKDAFDQGIMQGIGKCEHLVEGSLTCCPTVLLVSV